MSDYVPVMEISDKYGMSIKLVLRRMRELNVGVVKMTRAGTGKVANFCPSDRVSDVVDGGRSREGIKCKSDLRLSKLWKVSVKDIEKARIKLKLNPVIYETAGYTGPHYSKWQQIRLREELVSDDADQAEKFTSMRATADKVISNHDLGLYTRINRDYVPKEMLYVFG